MSKAQFMTQAAYSRHRGVSRSAVAKAVADGRIVLIDGRIDPTIADAQWKTNTRARSDVRSHGKSEQPDATTGGSYGTARARRELAEASLAEIQLAEKRGELINRAGVEMAIETGFRQIRDSVMAAPDRMTFDTATRAIVRDGLRAAFDDAAKAFPSLPGPAPAASESTTH
jgi:hypothetical protein